MIFSKTTVRISAAAAAASAAVMTGVITTTHVSAVLYGDEQYGDVSGGKFWAFYSGGIAVIDPSTCTIEETIVSDHDGNPLPTSWNDGVYMQTSDDDEGYIMIGSRVDETNALGDVVSHAFAVSTTLRKVVSKVEVGPRAVHSYGIYPQNEFWVHSDGNGLFYVIHMDDLTKTTHDDIEAKVDVPAHGKLVWDEDPAELGSRGFATSTGEPFLFEIDLANKVQTSAYDFSSFARDCTGLHAIAYSGVNNHVYAECAGPGGILEFDVSGGTIAFVHQFENATGALYETPKGDMVVASNKGGNLLHVFLPNEPGAKSSLEHNVPMPGNPSTVSFYTHPVNGGDDGETETIVCAPLTENLNQNHRREDGSLACDPYGSCTGAATADDAEHGVCLHESNPEVSFQLMRVMEDDTTDTTDLPAACARCADAANFNFEEGSTVRTCVCTPSCGLCDTEPDLSDDASGYMCINLSAYIAAETSDASTPVVQATLIANAGGVRQGAPFGEAAECSFGHAYRPHKRGTKYDASISTVPTNSIVVVNMDAMEKTCQVDLPGEPSRVLYAPLAPVEADGIANGGDGGSGAAGSSIIGGGVAGRIVMLSSVAGASYILLGLLV